MEFWIADFYGWLWIIGTIYGMWYVYRVSKPYLKKIDKKINKKMIKKKIKPFMPQSTPLVNLSN
jgi:hypothetical protein